MNYILFDDDTALNMRPLSYTRPVADFLLGMSTIRQKWESHLNAETSSLTASYLKNHFPIRIGLDNLLINGSVIPSSELARELLKLESGSKLVHKKQLIGLRMPEDQLRRILASKEVFEIGDFERILQKTDFRNVSSAYLPVMAENVYDIFGLNEDVFRKDYDRLSEDRKSVKPDSTTTILGDEVFLEEGSKVRGCILNSETGPIYISKGAEIMEGSVIRGPFYLGENSTVKMGAKIYGATSIGKYCKVGGELNNVVMFDYSNKGHDGFLGNSVIGSWCNLGADTNCSNLKNNYGIVKMWDYNANDFSETNRQFCGMVMGDHSKTGINTMINTGTVMGVSSNVFGGGFPPKFIPSFCWGGNDGFEEYDLKKAEETARKMMERRDLNFSANEEVLFQKIASLSNPYRQNFLK